MCSSVLASAGAALHVISFKSFVISLRDLLSKFFKFVLKLLCLS